MRFVEKFNLWIKAHRFFALAAPLVAMFLVYFITSTIGAMRMDGQNLIEENGYNDSLPGRDNELEVQRPNELYKKSQRDSMELLRGKAHLGNITGAQRKNDSLEHILEQLDNFSLDESTVPDGTTIPPVLSAQRDSSGHTDKKTAAEERLEYRKLILEARNERRSISQDYSAPVTDRPPIHLVPDIHVGASIYHDQFILPGDRVTLILDEDFQYLGRYFPKNTFVYATANIQGSRVLLNISNIAKVPIFLKAKDLQDGIIGLYNQRAGELFQEFTADLTEQGINEGAAILTGSVDVPMADSMIRSFGNFFRKKKYKQNDRILLIDGYRLILVPKK